jgi:hypothetical protein
MPRSAGAVDAKACRSGSLRLAVCCGGSKAASAREPVVLAFPVRDRVLGDRECHLGSGQRHAVAAENAGGGRANDQETGHGDDGDNSRQTVPQLLPRTRSLSRELGAKLRPNRAAFAAARRI